MTQKITQKITKTTSNSRWAVLACFALAAGMSQLLWLNFAPLLSQVEKLYDVTEARASLLILVFPLIYVLLSIHAGSLTDRRGYRYTLVAGTLIMAVFSCLRIYTGSFLIMLAAQIGIAAAQPYVVNSITKLVLDWFAKEHEAMATGLGTMGMFIGMALGMAITPPLVEAYGLQISMAIFAAAAWLIFFACLIWVRPNPNSKHSSSEQIGHGHAVNFSESFSEIIRNSELLFVFFLAFLGLGYFNGLTTWLEPILAPNGINSIQAGVAGGVLIAGGIFGSAVIPALSDKMKARKPLLLLCLLLSCATIYPLTFSHSYSTVLTFGAVQGFFFLPAFALLLEMCSELAGPKLVGAATGILMLAGNAGGVIVIIAMEWIKGDSPTFVRAVLLLVGVLVVSVATAIRLRETFSRRALA